jgi:hypothetical protein
MSESANRRWVLAMLSSVARDVKFLAWWLIPSAIMPWPSVLRGLFSHLWVGRLEGSRTAASLSSVDKGSCSLGATPREDSGDRTRNGGLQ